MNIKLMGIDPGVSGAFAIIDVSSSKSRFLHVEDLPTIKLSDKGDKKEIDIQSFSTIFELHTIRLCVLEKVGAMTYTDASGQKRGQGAAASFAFGKGYGSILGVLGSLQIPTQEVIPAVWKILMQVNRDKNTSIARAKSLFPEAKPFLQRKKDDGRAEAILLAEFGRRFLK